MSNFERLLSSTLGELHMGILRPSEARKIIRKAHQAAVEAAQLKEIEDALEAGKGYDWPGQMAGVAGHIAKRYRQLGKLKEGSNGR